MVPIHLVAVVMSCGLLLAACGNTQIDPMRAALTVACAPTADIPAGAWVCPEPRALRCDELATTTLYIPEGNDLACEHQAITLVDDGPFTPGDTQAVSIQSDNGNICAAQLTVVDETPPFLVAHTLKLWPPNHKLHTIDVNDCVTADDDCDGPLRGEFIWASSDEPTDELGDGRHTPDIVMADNCQQIAVRAERQGTQDGRVYTLGVRVVDSNGNDAEALCHVMVDHDQGEGHSSVDSGEAYRVTFDGTDNTPTCNVEQP